MSEHELPRRLVGLTTSLNDIFDETTRGRQVRCLECGHTEPARAEYWRKGWPTHHGQTMRLAEDPSE